MNTKNDEKAALDVGDYLKQSRISKGLTIEDVVKLTKIRYPHIEAIENNNYEKLPERTYTLGYIVTYAKFLNLDYKHLLAIAEKAYKLYDPKYDNMIQNKVLEKQYNPVRIVCRNIIDFIIIIFSLGKYKSSKEGNSKNNKQSGIFLFIISLVILVIMLVLIGGYFLSYKKQPKVIIQENPVKINSNIASQLDFQQTKDKNVDQIINDKDAIIANTNKNNLIDNTINNKTVNWPSTDLPSIITLKFNQIVWIKIYNKLDNSIVYLDAIFKPGDSFNVPNVPNIMMDTGNYKGMYLVVNGNNINITSNKLGNVVDGILLNSDDLLNKYKQEQ